MLTADQIEALGDYAVQLLSPVTEYLIEDIAERISEAGQLTGTAVGADMVFGSLRAAKYRKWNSTVGIDGAIRKAGMLACVLLLTAIDMMMHVDVLGWLPVDTRNVLDACGVVKMGVTELFPCCFFV